MKIKENKLFQSVKEYLTIYLPKQKNASSLTVKTYRESLNQFITYLAIEKKAAIYSVTFDDITQGSITAYLSYISDKKQCTTSTLNLRLSAIRAFLRYAGNKDAVINAVYLAARNVPFRKDKKELTVLHFSENALEAMLKQPDPKKKNQHRDLFFMILLYDTGARNGEMLDLTPVDIVTKGTSPYVVINGKGQKIRTVPIMEKTAAHFHSYIKRMGLKADDDSTPLFYTLIHGVKCRMSDDNVARFIDKYAALARNECDEVPYNVTPHMWRHSRAIHLYRKGVPLPLISEWLGHSNLETTLIYAYADTEMKRTAIEKATADNHPLRKQLVQNPNGEDDDSIRQFYGLK